MSKTDLLYIENDWKTLTTNGNEIVIETTEKALSKYKKALGKAEQLMEHFTKCIDFKIPIMPIFLISCNNLAEAYSVLKKWDKADKMLKRGVFYIEFLRKKELDPKADAVFSKWLFKQLLLYKEFSVRSNQPEKFKVIVEKLKQDSDYFASAKAKN